MHVVAQSSQNLGSKVDAAPRSEADAVHHVWRKQGRKPVDIRDDGIDKDSTDAKECVFRHDPTAASSESAMLLSACFGLDIVQ
jgi:hypothetical protein